MLPFVGNFSVFLPGFGQKAGKHRLNLIRCLPAVPNVATEVSALSLSGTCFIQKHLSGHRLAAATQQSARGAQSEIGVSVEPECASSANKARSARLGVEAHLHAGVYSFPYDSPFVLPEVSTTPRDRKGGHILPNLSSVKYLLSAEQFNGRLP